MCLILQVPADVVVSDEKIITAWENNRDGMGIMAHVDGEIRSFRSLADTPEKVLRAWKRFSGLDRAVHFRTRTSGEISKDMSHPFRVLNKRQDGADLFMMHNGVLGGMPRDNAKGSDTWHFVNRMLRPFIKHYGLGVLHDNFFRDMLDDYVGNGNKLLFLDDTGQWTFINKQAGTETAVPGCWASNTYSLAPKYKTPITSIVTNHGGNYYGNLANKVVPGPGTPLPAHVGAQYNYFNDDDSVWNWPNMRERDIGTPPYNRVVSINKPSNLPAVLAAVKEEEKEEEINAYEGNYSQFYGGFALGELVEKDDAELFKFVVMNPEDATDILKDMCEELALLEEEDEEDEDDDDDDDGGSNENEGVIIQAMEAV